LPDSERHYYELIPQGHPCHIYFDLEYQRAWNPRAADDGGDAARVACLVRSVRTRLAALGYVAGPDDAEVVELDSSTATKFSCHVIVRLPNAVFADNGAVGPPPRQSPTTAPMRDLTRRGAQGTLSRVG
jgi:DNA-directed primase/polymerase protein